MSAFITLSNLAWSPPDGRPLFTGLDLTFGPERAGLVGRNGVGKTTLLKLISGELTPQAGTVTVQGRVGVLAQAVRTAPGETVADLFGSREALDLLARADRGEASPDELADADWTLETRMAGALQDAGLAVAPGAGLETLSGGQRTRAGLAALIFREPDVLILDEPTNNLDRDGRAAVASLLAGWRKGAIVVSHDRALLELMDATVELTTLGATRYGGGWSRYRELKALELAAAESDLAEAEKRLADLARTAQTAAERKARKDGAGKRKAARGGMPRIVLGMMKNASEATGGEQARLAERRQGQARSEAAEARRRVEVLQPFAVKLAATGLAPGREVLRLEDVVAGWTPGRAVLEGVSLRIAGPERVAVVGPNGAGKSTLLAVAAGALTPWAGRVDQPLPLAMLDQTVSLLDRGLSIREAFLHLNPGADENACRAALARFMFRAEAALQTVGSLSGGQLLRAGLACVLGGLHPPPLLILDEPTNHLDLESIQAVEAGLRAYDGALLVVSHDEAFLGEIGIGRRVALCEGRVSAA
jgi:ATPase subunit of ABC transporter with duplicated ATPase domains